MVKITTMRKILALATSQSLLLYQVDVNNAFLHRDLKEDKHMKNPSSMPICSPTDVCKLKCSLHDLKQAPQA